jgi:serine/threonine protein kinase
MGTVYRATHIALDHVVALKVISAELAADDNFRARFRSESRIAVSLRHPNVVPIHHAGEEDGLLFVTMDLIDGPDLRRMLISGGPLPADRAISIIGQVASALDVAHARGLVHRDIKPGNILVDTDAGDHAYLTDFGLAKRFDQGTEAGALTRTGAFVGTLDYVAPEQIRGDRVDARTDVYALGCVLYESISGKAPFSDREENVAKIYAHLQDEPPWLPGESGVEGEIDEVIARALAKEPRDRFPSAGDLARAASAAIEGQELLRSAERSVATGKAAPETGEPITPPIEDTVESDPGLEPEPTQPLSTVPETTAEHPGPTRAAEVPEPPQPPPPAAEARSGRPRWGRIALALGVVVAIVAAGVVAFDGGGDSAGNSEGPIVYADPTVDGQLTIGAMPVGVAAGNGKVAVATRAGRQIGFVDEKTGKADGTVVNLPGEGEDVAIADGSAWVTVPDASKVVRAPLNGDAPTEISVDSGPFGITSDGSSIWVAEPEAREVSSIDPATNEVSTSIPIDASDTPAQIAFGEGRLWVVDRDGAQVFFFDPSDPTAQQSVTVGENPKGVVVADGSVWVANTIGQSVTQLSPDGDELDEIPVGGEPRGLAYGFGRIWIANGNGKLQAINPSDGNSLQSVRIPGSESSPEEVAIGSDHVWVTTGTGGSLAAIKPSEPKG